MDKLEKIRRLRWKERLQVSKIVKFEGDLSIDTKVKLLKVAKLYRSLYGGAGVQTCPPPPAIETFVNFCNFVELHLRSFKTYHFQTWLLY